MALKVNPPAALRIPDKILKDPELRAYFQDVQTILFQLWSKTGTGNGPILANNGGTGFDEYAIGDMLYADSTSTLAKLAKPATEKSLLTMTAAGEPIWKTPRYGSFYDTTTQTAAAINTAYPMTFNSTDVSSGVSIGTPTSRIAVNASGIYNLQFSAQLDKTTGGTGIIYIWIRKNGVDVPYSASQVRIQGNNAEVVAAWNWIINLAANDYVELMWSTDDTSLQIISVGASSPVPAIPSIILTVTDNVSA